MKKTLKDLSKIIIPWVIAIALFMETLDVTIVSTAIPKIAISLQVSAISLKVALTSYLLSLAVFIPISGWMADKFGTKRVFSLALLLFTLSSIFCGMSNNLTELIISRILQGLGGALMMPVGRLILLKAFPKSDLVRVTNYATIPSLIGPALGPVVGGAITTFSSWRWVFFVNIPFGLLGALLTLKYVKDYKAEHVIPFDVPGFILFGVGLAGLSFGFDSIGERLLSVNVIFMILSSSLLCLVLYFWYYQTAKNPVFDLKVFKIRTFRITVLGSLWSRLGIGGIPFLLPLLFQIGFGLSPLYSGLLIFPLAIAMLLMKFFVKKLLKLYGFRKILIINPMLVGVSMASFAFVTKITPYSIILLLVFVNGLVTSLQFSCMNILSYVDLTDSNVSKGTSIASAIQQLSMCFGVAVSALVIKIFVGFNNHLTMGDVMPLHNSFFAIGGITFVSFIVFRYLQKSDGQAASGHNIAKVSGSN